MTQNITVAKVMLVEGNRVVRADKRRNALNSGEFLDNMAVEKGVLNISLA
ncbi:hypothetical protein [Enterobacter sp.]